MTTQTSYYRFELKRSVKKHAPATNRCKAWSIPALLPAEQVSFTWSNTTLLMVFTRPVLAEAKPAVRA